MLRLINRISIVAFLGLVLVSACGAADETEPAAVAAAESEQPVVGAACSPFSNGPLPTCGTQREYCDVGSACDATGVCRARPTGCFAIFDPVCGCDRRTYSNACEAAKVGVSVRSKGACR